MNINGKWYTEPQIEAYVTELENKVAELEAKHWNECRQIARYDDELRKAKELLKAAVEDLSCGGENNKCTKSCKTCIHSSIKGYGCRYFGEYHWKHEAEALALIGEDTNVSAREEG